MVGMSGHHGAVPEGHRFRPPSVPTEVRCCRCGREYQSYLIQWEQDEPVARPLRTAVGTWRCPTPGCVGQGFGHDIVPTDPEYVDEFGRAMGDAPGAMAERPGMGDGGFAGVEPVMDGEDGPESAEVYGASDLFDYRVGPFDEMDHDGWWGCCVPEFLPMKDRDRAVAGDGDGAEPSAASIIWPLPEFNSPTDALFELFDDEPHGLINAAYLLDLADAMEADVDGGGDRFDDARYRDDDDDDVPG